MRTKGITVTAKRLPKLPSDLLEAAIEDALHLQSLPDYKLDMSEWFHDDGEICTVCLAGAFLAHRAEWSDKGAGVDLVCLGRNPKPIERAMSAIDYFRCGDMKAALETLQVELPFGMPEQVDVNDGFYDDDHGKLFADMRKIVVLLRKFDL